MEELNDMPCLDAVVREVLRLYAPVPVASQVAVKDDTLPLGSPIRLMKGDLRIATYFLCRIRKSQTILIPISTINRSQKV